MYISKFSAFNFRSLKQISIKFEKGKNVIVGKNNCGKSNIIRGLEILTGEKYPSYQNITEKDFYCHEVKDEDTGEVYDLTADNFYLEVTLTGRDVNEKLINTIKKKTAFSKVVNGINGLYSKNEQTQEITIAYDLFQNLEDITDRDDIEVLRIAKNGDPIKTEWLLPADLIPFLKASRHLKIFFSQSRLDDEKSGFGLIVVDQKNDVWVSHFFSKKLRDALLTTTVISATRSHKEDLKVLEYTWFGKLIGNIWNNNKLKKVKIDDEREVTYNDIIVDSSKKIEEYVNLIFTEDTEKIRKLLSGAIAHDQITFKFFNDQKNEHYKNIQVYVNDGINRPLLQKGTGMQSAVIIALFTLYCNQYHCNSSLLITEEPELYLHPQARRVISAELNKYLSDENTKERQLIVSTHSTEYLKNVEPANIVRVCKDAKTNSTIATQLKSETASQITDDLKRFLWQHNSEMFFADKVILVEGGEYFLLPAIVDKFTNQPQYLDYKNISVTRVNGKGNFLPYIKMLESFGIDYLVLGDLDCFHDEVFKIIKHLKIEGIDEEEELIKKALRNLPVRYGGVADRVKGIAQNIDAQGLKTLFDKFKNGTIKNDDEQLLGMIAAMESRHFQGSKAVQVEKEVGNDKLNKALKVLRENRIFIWSKGVLEDYYNQQLTQSKGTKDTKALNASYRLQEKEILLSDLFIHVEEIELLCKYIADTNTDEIGEEHPTAEVYYAQEAKLLDTSQ